MTNKFLNYVGPWNSTGYGYASIGYLEVLSKICKTRNITLAFRPIGEVQNTDPELLEPKYKDLLKHKDEPIRTACPVIGFWHPGHLGQVLSDFTGIKTGITTFEVSGLDANEVASLKQCHFVTTACGYTNGIIKRYLSSGNTYNFIPHYPYQLKGISNILRSPDPKSFFDKLIGYSFNPDAIFLSNIGKYELRKGYDLILDLLDLLDRPTVLCASWYNPFMPSKYPFGDLIFRNWEAQQTNSNIKVYTKDNKAIILMPPLAARRELYSIAMNCDFYLCMSRAEGFNLPLHDMNNHYIPCIYASHSANQDISAASLETRSFHVLNTSPAKDDMFFNGKFYWYEPQLREYIDHIVNRDIKYIRGVKQRHANNLEGDISRTLDYKRNHITTLMNNFIDKISTLQ